VIALACTPHLHAADAANNPAAAAAPAGATAPRSATESGLAAVYSDSLHGRKTASGQTYDRDQLTAAHKTLPFGTKVKVTNTKNQKTVTVRINDRGPTQQGRILDISPRAAKALGIGPHGMAEVTAEVVAEAPKSGKK
jgi:rare lipoprotein A